MYVARADGTGGLEPWTTPNVEQQHAQQVTPDGSALLIQQRPAENNPDSDLLIVPFDQPDGGTPVFDEPGTEVQGAIHPSGGWMAYVSDRGGRQEVWITEFPRGRPIVGRRVTKGA